MGSTPLGMTSNRPYLLRALYQWITDNGLTPHLLVDALLEGVDVPRQAVRKGKVVLNVAGGATEQLQLGDEIISFKARFSGKPYPVSVPTKAVLAIYANENGQGMMFAADGPPNSPVDSPDDAPPRGHLKVVK